MLYNTNQVNKDGLMHDTKPEGERTRSWAEPDRRPPLCANPEWGWNVIGESVRDLR